MMPKIASREYKIMLHQAMFVDRKQAVQEFGREFIACAQRVPQVKCRGKFGSPNKHEIAFLDSLHNVIALNNYVLRQRVDLEQHTVEYTLKCRSPDRYIAAGANMNPAAHVKAKPPKFEEDIGAPFISRFSHSCTVTSNIKTPQTLGEAAAIFPVLAELNRDGQSCPLNLMLRSVNTHIAFERVIHGPELELGNVKAETALILWSDGPDGRPLVAEFSFRYKQANEAFEAEHARIAYDLYMAIQRLDWCHTNSPTKTEYIYNAR